MIKDKLIYEITIIAQMDIPDISKHSIQTLKLIRDLALANTKKDVILKIVNNPKLLNLFASTMYSYYLTNMMGD